MPIYMFHCQECGQGFEVRASIKEKEAGLKPACPQCSSQVVQQVLTAGLVLHGGKISAPSSCGPNAGLGCCG